MSQIEDEQLTRLETLLSRSVSQREDEQLTRLETLLTAQQLSESDRG